MALDPRGVPLRLRSLLAGLPPERKDALRALAGRVRPGRGGHGGDDATEAAVAAWFAGHGAEVKGAVLEVGPRGLARRVGHPSTVDVVDPWGRGGATLIGPVGPVVPSSAYEAVVAPLRGDDPVTAPDLAAALVTLVGALVPGGVLLAAVVAAPGATLDAAAAALDALDGVTVGVEVLDHGRTFRVAAS